MAFRINVKSNTASSGASKGKNFLEDIRVFAVLMVVACVGLIALIVVGSRSIDETNADIKQEMKTYEENQLSIANLKIMIEMETRVESMNCVLTDLTFGSESADDKNSKAAASSSNGLVNQMQVQISVRGTYTDIMKLAESIVTDQELMRIDAIHMMPMTQDGLKEAQITIMKFSKK